jgi:hypothetical protein
MIIQKHRLPQVGINQGVLSFSLIGQNSFIQFQRFLPINDLLLKFKQLHDLFVKI